MPSKPLETLDLGGLELALTAFEPNPEKREVLKRAMLAHQDLALIPDEELFETDTTTPSRLTYVASILRLLAFIREPSFEAGHKEAQAKLALSYIRHAESTQLAAIQVGRTAGDGELAKTVQDLRRKVTEVAEQKARHLSQAKEAAGSGAA